MAKLLEREEGDVHYRYGVAVVDGNGIRGLLDLSGGFDFLFAPLAVLPASGATVELRLRSDERTTRVPLGRVERVANGLVRVRWKVATPILDRHGRLSIRAISPKALARSW